MNLAISVCLLLAGLALTPKGAAAQSADSLPPGVTREMIARGKTVFGGAGLCAACHGTNAKGAVGPDLTDREWLHHDGSYEALVKQILTGIDDQQSKTGQIMPPKGGSAISDDDVKAVAAYVWTLSHKGKSD
jgi:mono/diheme cytochrome c family protein